MALTIEKLLEHIKSNIEFQKQKQETIRSANLIDDDKNTDDISDNIIKILSNVSEHDILNIFNENTFGGLLSNYNCQLARCGSIIYESSDSDSDNEDEENLSLISSLMTIIKPSFRTFTYEQQLLNIRKLNEKLVHDFNSQNIFSFFDYSKYGLTKQNVFNDIKNHANNKIVLKFLSDYFCFNIWILFHDTNEIYMSYANNKCNTYRKNIILFYNSETQVYQPICKLDLETFIFEHDDELITHLYDNINMVNPINVDLKKHSLDFSDMNTDDLFHYSYINKPKIKKYKNSFDNEEKTGESHNDKIINVDENNNKNNDKQPSNNQKLFIKKNIDVEYNDDDLNETITKKLTNEQETSVTNPIVTMKMKLKELQNIAETQNISIVRKVNGKQKNKTKEELINDIQTCNNK